MKDDRLIIEPNTYGCNQVLLQMTEYGETDSFFATLLGDSAPSWQFLAKLTVDYDLVVPSGKCYLQHFLTRGFRYAPHHDVTAVGHHTGDTEEQKEQSAVSRGDKLFTRTVNETEMVAMLASLAKAAGQMASLKQLQFRAVLPMRLHVFHVDYFDS
ncbi:hypothetical protein CORC01_00854 [Colletotrichum orchidophilum]|uniref:Uncharacterized protein n=1 Tax=Colletotrichum orchidophilum TaxID=1209926 RepID=A0A1G4BRD6_9PEZI|nr:uncharacterized protein CORC01_00854 [Colletotrichum orchidophilum]OHF03992.1 hypothetical protein CORC01_00854 [Colletotrichum orchidophilum]